LLGSPQLPSQSAMERLAEERARTSPEVQALEAKVAEAPSDAQAWIDLARAYADLERSKDAVGAFAQAMALGRTDIDILRQYAHAAILAQQGMVAADAQNALRRVLVLDSTDATARFFLALAKAQADDIEGALTDWLALEHDLPAAAPLRQALAENIDKAARSLGKDPANLPGRATGTAGSGAQPGPSSEDMANAAQMSPEEREAFIRSMVDRLAAKMKENPQDLDGWLKLANAYRVLEDYDHARDAWGKAAGLAPARLDVQLDYAGSLIEGRADLDKQVPAEFPAVVARIRNLDPNNPLGLFYAGVVARAEGKAAETKELWGKVMLMMPEGSPERAQLQHEIDALDKPAN
jgi:cytochrome c-type biogenesis protein CcmH